MFQSSPNLILNVRPSSQLVRHIAWFQSSSRFTGCLSSYTQHRYLNPHPIYLTAKGVTVTFLKEFQATYNYMIVWKICQRNNHWKRHFNPHTIIRLYVSQGYVLRSKPSFGFNPHPIVILNVNSSKDISVKTAKVSIHIQLIYWMKETEPLNVNLCMGFNPQSILHWLIKSAIKVPSTFSDVSIHIQLLDWMKAYAAVPQIVQALFQSSSNCYIRCRFPIYIVFWFPLHVSIHIQTLYWMKGFLFL